MEGEYCINEDFLNAVCCGGQRWTVDEQKSSQVQDSDQVIWTDLTADHHLEDAVCMELLTMSH